MMMMMMVNDDDDDDDDDDLPRCYDGEIPLNHMILVCVWKCGIPQMGTLIGKWW